MQAKKTEINSQSEKIKKFRIPKFPSAAVILFFVLLFVIFLSWIPHKGWIDTSNPILFFDQNGLYGANGIKLGCWNGNPNWENIENEILILTLTPAGTKQLSFLLNALEVSESIAKEIETAASISGIQISNIELGFVSHSNKSDWNLVAINYSGLTFDLSISNDNNELVSASVEFDKVFASKLSAENNGEFVFNILSGSISSPYILDFFEDKPLEFSCQNIAPEWFNFWKTNYYVGDVNGRYGLLNIPFIIIAGFFKASGVILYLFCIGAFISVMLQSGALEAGTSSLVKKLKGKELLLIPILFTIFCTGGTTYGMQEETLGLIPLIIPFLVLAGFDTMTGLLVVVVGTTTGVASSVIDPFSVGVMADSLQTSEATANNEIISIGTGILIRIIMYFVFLIVGAIFCTCYGWRARKGKEFVLEPDMYEKNKEWAQEMLGSSDRTYPGLTKRQAIGLGIFGSTFVIMVFSLLPWISWFPALENSKTWIIFSSLFFAKALFGQWQFVQLAFLFITSAFLLGKVFGMKQKETNKAIIKGIKNMFILAMILMFSRSVAIVFTYSGLITSLIALMLGGSNGGSFSGIGLAWILLPMFIFFSIFIPSTSGLAGIIGPILGPIIWTLGKAEENYLGYAAIVLAVHPLAQGAISMFMPTTGLVVAQAEVAKVNFAKALPILGSCALVTIILGMVVVTSMAPIYI